jgi:hypothetical protein
MTNLAEVNKLIDAHIRNPNTQALGPWRIFSAGASATAWGAAVPSSAIG